MSITTKTLFIERYGKLTNAACKGDNQIEFDFKIQFWHKAALLTKGIYLGDSHTTSNFKSESNESFIEINNC